MLDRRSDRLAHLLILAGAQPDRPIALLLDRSLETLTAMLGVLKAGAAYLPLEAAFPEQRLRFMLEEAGSPLILTQEALIDRLSSGCGRPLTFEALTPRLAEQPDTPVGRRASPE